MVKLKVKRKNEQKGLSHNCILNKTINNYKLNWHPLIVSKCCVCTKVVSLRTKAQILKKTKRLYKCTTGTP